VALSLLCEIGAQVQFNFVSNFRSHRADAFSIPHGFAESWAFMAAG
jgi:hypothetical protein